MLEAKTHRVVLGGSLLMLVLVGMLVRHAWPLWTGEPIYLRVAPVDPRDVFRGDYVILTYPIQRLRTGAGGTGQANEVVVQPIGDWWSGSDESHRRDRVLFVQLEPRPTQVPGVPMEHVAVTFSDRPQPGSINLQGRSSYRWGSGWMDYGIDAFFVQEGSGRAIEVAIRSGGPVYAEVLVTRSGRARVKDLIIEGRRVSDEP